MLLLNDWRCQQPSSPTGGCSSIAGLSSQAQSDMGKDRAQTQDQRIP